MTIGGSGYSIGFKELYDSIASLTTKVDLLGSQHAQQLAEHNGRLELLEKGMRFFYKRIEESKGSSWQVNTAIATSGVSFLTALATVILK